MTLFRRLILIVLALALSCGGNRPKDSGPDAEPEATIEQGEALLKNGDYPGAVGLFERFLRERPNVAQGHYYLGLALSRTGESDAAEQEYKLAIGFDGNLAEAHNNLGLLLLEKGDLVHAEAELHTYLRQVLDDSGAHYNYGLVLAALGREREAIEYWEKAAKLDPEDPAPLLILGDKARKHEEHNEALALYRRARRVDPENATAVLQEGQTLLLLKELDQAKEVLFTLSQMPTADPETIATAGMLLARVAEPEPAITLYLAALERDAGYTTARFLLANVLARVGQFAEAADHYKVVLDEIGPDDDLAKEARQRLDACRKNLEQ